MVKLAPTEKKFKGKKKVKNVFDKQKKGLKLNKIDRKKVVKLTQKKNEKEELRKNVKQELEKFESMNAMDEDTRDSLCSESSFGSQPAPKVPRKRVSFAGNLERTKLFDKNVKDLDIKPSEASPGKGILRAKLKKEQKEKMAKKKVKKLEIVDDEMDSSVAAVDEEKKTSHNDSAAIPKKKKVILQVTKKTKEQIMAMPRKERKAFIRELKAQKNPMASKSLEAIQLWEKVRSSKTPKQEKDDSISKLVALVKGSAAKFIYAHDTCRVIECLVALKREGITNMLFNELTPELVRMTKSKYSRFFVLKMLKIGNKQQRDIIINAFNGHAVSLMRIVHAAEVLEIAYNEYSNAQQRFNIVSEFYGREFVMFRSDKPLSLDEIVKAEPAKTKLIVQHLEEQLQIITEKTTLRHSLTHRLLLDFMNHCSEDQRTNIIDTLKDKIPEIIHTPDGSKVAMKCIWNSSSKDRKLIIKNFKDLSVKAAMEHYGHRVLYAIFDSVDDTVLVNKYIISELANEIDKLVKDNYGCQVLHYIVHPRDGRGMDKLEIQSLQEGDSNPHSKKDKKDRYAELFKGIQESLYTYLSANVEQLIFEDTRTRLIAACCEPTGKFDFFDRQVPAELRKQVYSAVAQMCKQEFIPMDSERLHIIEHTNGSWLISLLLGFDRNLGDEEKFSEALANCLNDREVGSWIACNKGSHHLLYMLKNGSPAAKQKVLGAVNRKQLKQYTCKGAILLMEEIKTHA